MARPLSFMVREEDVERIGKLRYEHPHPRVQQRCWVLWFISRNLTLAEARAGQRQVFFGDAAHFVLGTYLCWLWTKTRLFVKAAAGRQRYNVLGAWNAVTNTLLAVTNTTVVNADTACELLRALRPNR